MREADVDLHLEEVPLSGDSQLIGNATGCVNMSVHDAQGRPRAETGWRRRSRP